jgi:hypothetical protein
VATIALRNTPLAFGLLEKSSRRDAFALVAEGVDMLEEDFGKERFFCTRTQDILERFGRIANPFADGGSHQRARILSRL